MNEVAQHGDRPRGAVSSGGRRRPRAAARLLVAVGLVAWSIALYLNSLDVPFQFDGIPNILDNEAIRWESSSVSDLRRAATDAPLQARRPVALASLAINYRLGGYDVRGYHVVNICVHALSALGLYFLVLVGLAHPNVIAHCGHLNRDVVAGFAAFVWTSHPLNVQAVTYIVQRMASMAAMFVVWSMLAFLIATVRRGRWRVAWGATSALLFLAGLGSKETAIVLPLLLGLGWLLFGRKRLSRRSAVLFAACMAVSLLAALVAIEGPSAAVGMVRGVLGDQPEQLLTVPRAFFFTVSLALLPLPSRLNIDHHLPFSSGLFEPLTTFLAIVVLVALFLSTVGLAKRRPLLAFCSLWFSSVLLLESVGAKVDPVFEHRFYLPGMAMAVVVGTCLDAIGRRVGRWPAGGAGALIVLLLGWATHERNETWRSKVLLWSDAVEKSPEKARPRVSLIAALGEVGRTDEAQRHYEQLREIETTDGSELMWMGVAALEAGDSWAAKDSLTRAATVEKIPCMVYLGLATAHARLGEIPEATAQLHLYETICPGRRRYPQFLAETRERIREGTRALAARAEGQPDDLRTRFEFAATLLRTGEPRRALEHFQAIRERQPRHPAVLVNIGFCHLDLGQLEAADQVFREAIAAAPSHANAHYGLGQSADRQGRRDDARRAFERYVQLAPASDPFRLAAQARLDALSGGR